MFTLNKNYITNTFKLPGTTTIVILNGMYEPKLSDECKNLIFKNKRLKIPKNTRIEPPIHLLLLTSQNYQSSLEIVAEKGSYTTIIEEYASLEEDGYTNSIETKIIAKDGSSITLYKIQIANIAQANYQIKSTINQEQNSKITTLLINKGIQTALDTLSVKLLGKNSSYNINGINLLRNTQNVSHKIVIEHFAPDCSSNILFKGVISDQATSSFDCRVVAHPGANGTETHVANKNLLLSAAATVNTSPELEVYVDDVICTHSATVGQLDQNALFYLRSRGIKKSIAIKLLTAAFIQEITDQFAQYTNIRLKTITESIYE